MPSSKSLEELLATTLKNEVESDEETQQKNKEVQEQQTVCEQDKPNNVLKRKLQETNEISISSSSEESVSEAFTSIIQGRASQTESSDDDDDLVSKSELNKMHAEYNKVVQKLKELQEQQTVCEQEKLNNVLKRKHQETNQRSISPEESFSGASSFKILRRASPTESSDDDDEDLVLKSELSKMHVEYNKVVRKMKLKQKENEELRKRNDQLQVMNVSLQKQLLKLLNANDNLGQKTTNIHVSEIATVQDLRQKTTGIHESEIVTIQNLEGGNLGQKTTEIPESVTAATIHGLPERNKRGNLRRKTTEIPESVTAATIHSLPERNKAGNPPLFKHPVKHLKNNQMELASGVFITPDQWQKIVSVKSVNSSKMVRNLAVLLWDPETLKERSVTGAACRRYKKYQVEAKKALTPTKVDAVQNGLRYWLMEHQKIDIQEATRLSSRNQVRKMLSDKIMDVLRHDKKS